MLEAVRILRKSCRMRKLENFQPLNLAIAVMFGAALFFICPLMPAAMAESPAGSGHPAGKVLKGEINTFGVLTEEMQADLGLRCTRDGANAIRVLKVQLGREAYYK